MIPASGFLQQDCLQRVELVADYRRITREIRDRSDLSTS